MAIESREEKVAPRMATDEISRIQSGLGKVHLTPWLFAELEH
jgi:hypothetical protein